MKTQKPFSRTGIYMRLSRDDEKAGESMSIENQRLILHKFVEERGGCIAEEYIDDGWSGTDFDRPAVKRMLQDAQSGKIDTIVVKDLSRFGRNYIQAGQYIDYIFPAYGIRFIAVNDNIDTADRTASAMDMMPIMNVFNEWHAANTSRKIRAVLDASRRAGKYTGWNYPYGYRAGADENRSAVVDEEAAATVRRIFALRLQGNSVRTIARILSDEGIPNPASYFTKLNGKKSVRRVSPYWCPKTVAWILANPVYIGETVQHKTSSVSYKNHQVLRIPADEQIVKKNAHESIIGRSIWEKVQAMNRAVSRGRTDKNNLVHPLSGFLFCADCGKKLKIKAMPNRKEYRFYCRTYIDLGKNYCSSHCVSENILEKIILDDLRSLAGAVPLDEKKARENFIAEREKCAEGNRYSDAKKANALRGRLSELDKLLQSAFEEKVLGRLPETVFAGLSEKYRKERNAVESELAETEKRLQNTDREGDEAEEYLKKLRRYAACEELTREMCLQLIDFITVGESNEAGETELHIYYKFNLRKDFSKQNG